MNNHLQLSNRICAHPECHRRLKTSLVERKPGATHCFKHWRTVYAQRTGRTLRTAREIRSNPSLRSQARIDRGISLKSQEGYITPEAFIVITLLVLIVLLVFAILAENAEEQAWNTFKQEHNCVEIAHKKGGSHVGFGTGVTSSGKVGTGTIVITEDDQTAWKCDDGKTYWRND